MERTDTGYVQFLNLQNSLNQLRTQSMDWHLVALLLKLAEAIASGGGIFFSLYLCDHVSFSFSIVQENEVRARKKAKPEFPRKTLGRFL